MIAKIALIALLLAVTVASQTGETTSTAQWALTIFHDLFCETKVTSQQYSYGTYTSFTSASNWAATTVTSNGPACVATNFPSSLTALGLNYVTLSASYSSYYESQSAVFYVDPGCSNSTGSSTASGVLGTCSGSNSYSLNGTTENYSVEIFVIAGPMGNSAVGHSLPLFTFLLLQILVISCLCRLY